MERAAGEPFMASAGMEGRSGVEEGAGLEGAGAGDDAAAVDAREVELENRARNEEGRGRYLGWVVALLLVGDGRRDGRDEKEQVRVGRVVAKECDQASESSRRGQLCLEWLVVMRNLRQRKSAGCIHNRQVAE